MLSLSEFLKYIEMTGLEVPEAVQGVIELATSLPSSVKVVGGVFRATYSAGTNTWSIIAPPSDTGHNVIGYTGFSVSSGNLVIAHNHGFSQVITHLFTPDETMASRGMFMGASVGINDSRLSFYRMIPSTVAYIVGDGTSNANAYTVSGGASPVGTGINSITYNSGTGEILVQHAARGNFAGDVGISLSNRATKRYTRWEWDNIGPSSVKVFRRDSSGVIITGQSFSDEGFILTRPTFGPVKCPADTYDFETGSNVWGIGLFL